MRGVARAVFFPAPQLSRFRGRLLRIGAIAWWFLRGAPYSSFRHRLVFRSSMLIGLDSRDTLLVKPGTAHRHDPLVIR